MERFTAEERAEIEAHAQTLIAEEMSLRDLRKALGKTQAQLARKLNKPQATVSRMERQSDMLISTLDQVVHALGGRVRLVAELPGRKPLYLAGLADLATPGVAKRVRIRPVTPPGTDRMRTRKPDAAGPRSRERRSS
ncbi:MAG TPA: helix-turn-helix transcriptional regulator [Acetobacteraceae bacterium]|nr:helix-turn-helix transcriptional regulator [Acetobacteraceae bacterium]